MPEISTFEYCCGADNYPKTFLLEKPKLAVQLHTRALFSSSKNPRKPQHQDFQPEIRRASTRSPARMAMHPKARKLILSVAQRVGDNLWQASIEGCKVSP